MSEAQRWQGAPAGQDALRIFDATRAGGGPGELSAEMTVSELYRAYYKPVYLVAKDARQRNYEALDGSVAYWVAFTGDPPISAITPLHTGAFVAGLKQLPGRKSACMGNNTVRKHCGAIQAILDLCGPPDRNHRECLDLLDRVPYITRPPKHEKEAEDYFAYDEVVRLMDNADVATLPARLPCTAGAYMRRLYALIFNTTIRIGGAMGATWKYYQPGERDASGAIVGAKLVLPAGVAAKGRKDHTVQLNSVARGVIESMRGYHSERIFPWPWKWPGSRSNLYHQHALIVQCLPKHRQFAFHGVRKLTNYELARINPKACEKALGHKTGRVNVEAYTGAAIVRDAFQELEAQRPLPLTRDRQKQLFG